MSDSSFPSNMLPPKPENMCPQCPFARSTPKEYLDTRGQNGERFVGQAVGSFVLPCHMHNGFKDWREKPVGPGAATQCVGACIYRTNCGYDHLPASIPRLPADHERVFSSPAELLAHHKGTTVEEEREALQKQKPLLAMYLAELTRASVQFIPLPPKS